MRGEALPHFLIPQVIFYLDTGLKKPGHVTIDQNVWTHEPEQVFSLFKMLISGVLLQWQKAEYLTWWSSFSTELFNLYL
jgi:hypothetical protein